MKIVLEDQFKVLDSGDLLFRNNVLFEIDPNVKIKIEIVDKLSSTEDFIESVADGIRTIKVKKESAENLFLENDFFATINGKKCGFKLALIKTIYDDLFKVNYYIFSDN